MSGIESKDEERIGTILPCKEAPRLLNRFEGKFIFNSLNVTNPSQIKKKGLEVF
ncbi:hypothetical protein [Dysgonomonas massiliensis]|uniref:hypothetical protein n=1 Tax=Dysgonomonas massiliensis TaxID=2040292 RepID=UPI00135C32D5|nr:hypothetical protein [Dysgonomonas massiliensis]